MKRLSFVVLMMTFLIMANNAFASHQWYDQIGDWDEADKWAGDGIPDGSSEMKLKDDGGTAECTLDTVEGVTWETAQRLRVYDGAVLNIVEGGGMFGASWTRVGTDNSIGTVNQTGGTFRMRTGTDSAKIMVGDDPDSAGSEWRISGGVITWVESDEKGALFIGYEGGTGQFTVVGTDPTVELRKLFVGGDDDSDYGVGYLKYEIGAAGVSPIEVSNDIYIAREGGDVTNVAHLVLQLDAAPPAETDIVLAMDTGGGTIKGLGFDTVTGASSGAEGALVTLGYDSTNYYYNLTYEYEANADGNFNDLALVWVPEPATVALLGLGSLIAVRRRKK